METERLLIDAFCEEDKQAYFECVAHDKKVLKTFMCPYAETVSDFDFKRYMSDNDVFAVRLKETGLAIGIILLFGEKDGACEIGYALGSAYHGRGYATEAVRRFLSYCMDEKGFGKVYASFFTGNDASRRVMEKCGMSFDHFSEKELTYLGVERDLTYYSITRKSLP